MMKKKNVKSDTNVFKSAVDNTVDLKDGYCKGLQALKGNHPVRYAYQRLPRSIGVWPSIICRLRHLLSS